MAANGLNPDARRENVRALMRAAGIEEADAIVRLERPVLITADRSHGPAGVLADELHPVLSRTLETDLGPFFSRSYAVEVVIGRARARTSARKLYVTCARDAAHITALPLPLRLAPTDTLHPLIATMLACYVAGQTILRAVGGGIRNVAEDDLTVDYADLIPDPEILTRPIRMAEAYLAGAGAIGNGFLWAARHLDLRGRLHVADDDHVSSGNLQRQIWFEEADIDTPKAETLCRQAQSFLPRCDLLPAVCRLQDHPNRSVNEPWLARLIVAVDSRLARRRLQNELPGEVFDASTTGVEQIVLHYNRQPTELACLGCVYPRDPREVSQEEVIAGHLGISAADVRTERITPETASRICATHPQLRPDALVGLAFDTLYKQLCGSQQLRSTAGEQVLAPFAFVSVLAGAFLLVDLAMRVSGSRAGGNDWRISPWHAPDRSGMYWRRRRPDCACCAREVIRQTVQSLWSPDSTARGVVLARRNPL